MTRTLAAITRFFAALTEWSNGTYDRRRRAVTALFRAYHKETWARQKRRCV